MTEVEIRDEAARLVMNLTIMLRLGALGRATLPQARAGDPKAQRFIRGVLGQLYGLGVSSPVAHELLSGEVG